MKYLIAIALALIPFGAQAQQQNCGDTTQIVERLYSLYSERAALQALGEVQGVLTVFEFYANPETGTWTIVQSFPDGTSCMRASGTGYEMAEIEPAGVQM